jgi:hypothetical protein
MNGKFWLQAIVITVLAFFLIKPNFKLGGAKFAERLADVLLGFLMGLINGYLVLGSLWYYLDQTGTNLQITFPYERAVIRIDLYIFLLDEQAHCCCTLPWHWLSCL